MSSFLVISNWKARYAWDKVYGKAVSITNETGIDRKTIKPIQDGLYTRELGSTINTDKDVREYSCFCGELSSKLNEGEVCELCNTECVEQFGQDLNKYGWIDTEPYEVINPAAYELLTSLIGTKALERMLKYQTNINIEGTLDKDAAPIEKRKSKINYENIGLLEFKRRFVEIVTYYGKIKAAKSNKAELLLKYKNRIFVDKIPVYSTLLRPAYASGKKKMFSYDKINSYYTSIINNVKLLKSGTSKRLKVGGPLVILYAIQEALQNMYACTVTTKLSGKNKIIRGALLSTRTSFSSRAVITSLIGKYSGMDHLVVSYKVFIELYTLEILNCMRRGLGNKDFINMTTYELLQYLKLAKYKNEIDENIYTIVEWLIANASNIMWVALNRPPTMDLGSIQCLKIVHVLRDPNKSVMQLSLTSLASLTGDFDGDTLSIYRLLDKTTIEAFIRGLNPRILVVDPTGDSFFNTDMSIIKDTYTNLNSFLLPLKE